MKKDENEDLRVKKLIGEIRECKLNYVKLQ